MKLKKFLQNAKKIFVSSFIFLSAYFFLTPLSHADAPISDTVCGVYLTGIGCSNCAVIDSVLFQKIVADHPHLIVLEYEIYKTGKENDQVKNDYFQSFFPGQPVGVPAFIFTNEKKAIGRIKAAQLLEGLGSISANPCPMPDGTSVNFQDLDLTNLKGKINIWTKNRILSTDNGGGDNRVFKQLLLEPNIWKALSKVSYKKIDSAPVEISQNVVLFQNAVQIGDWILQWNDIVPKASKAVAGNIGGVIVRAFFGLMVIFVILALLKIERTAKGFELKLRQAGGKTKDYLAVALGIIGLFVFFIFAKNIDPVSIEKAGYFLPLPIFTFIVGFLDGFNPCNMFVLTCLMALLVSSSGSKMRLYIVGVTFIVTVFVLYFLFMAAWLNVFQYVNFITPIRIAIGLLSLVAGFINCKELLFFKKGVSLTIPDAQRGPLMKKIYAMKAAVQKGSLPVLISSAFALAILSSLVEIPCTAGFPIIYTSILSGKIFDDSLVYYAYLIFYNILYILPLLAIVIMFIVTFKGAPISQRQMEILKFVGGFVMILLGIVLLTNPGLIGLNLG